MKRAGADDAFGIVAYTLKDTLSPYGSVSRGVCSQDGKALVSVDERLEIAETDGSIQDADSGLSFSGDEFVSMNFWVCQPAIFPKIEADFRTFLIRWRTLPKEKSISLSSFRTCCRAAPLK